MAPGRGGSLYFEEYSLKANIVNALGSMVHGGRAEFRCQERLLSLLQLLYLAVQGGTADTQMLGRLRHVAGIIL